MATPYLFISRWVSYCCGVLWGIIISDAVYSQPFPNLIIHSDTPSEILVSHTQRSLSEDAQSACPPDLETLTSGLLIDLPSYTNRVRQRIRSQERHTLPGLWVSNMIVAGRADYEPLPVVPPVLGTPAIVEELQQVFFTTLDRMYGMGKQPQVTLLPSYHWLFLARSEQGWQMVMLLTRIGHPAADQPSLPPRDSSYGAIAQAIRLWLRDCQAGSVRPKPTLRLSS
jgi:hypothetical protein